jgi:hypothetical protein
MTHDQVPQFIRRLMPSASPSEQQKAAEDFREYMKVVLGIYERILREDNDSRKSGFRDRVDDTHTI